MRAVLLRAAEVVVNQPAVPAVSWLEQVLCEPVKPRDIERALQAVDRLIGARKGDVEAYAAPFGGTAEQVRATLANISTQLRTSPGHENLLNSIGVQTRNANGSLRDTAEIFMDLQKRAMQMPEMRAKPILEELGESWDLFREIKDNADKFFGADADAKEFMKRIGLDPKAVADAGNEIMTEFRALQMKLGGLIDKMAMRLGPMLIEHMRAFSDWLVAHQDDIVAAVEAVSKALLGVAEDLVALAKNLQPVWTAFEGMAKAVTGRDGLQAAMELVLGYATGAWLIGMRGAVFGVQAAFIALVAYLSTRVHDEMQRVVGDALDKLNAAIGYQTPAGYDVQKERSLTTWDRIKNGWDWITGKKTYDEAFKSSWSGGGRARPQSLSSAQEKANAAESFAFWKANGFTDEQAAGMVANEVHESRTNPRAVGDGGRAIGIFQHHPDRRAKILAGTGIDMSSATHLEQLQGALWELRNYEKRAMDAVLNAKTAEEAAAAFSMLFERPADAQGQARARGATAAKILPQLQAGDTPPRPRSKPSTVPAVGSVQGLAPTAPAPSGDWWDRNDWLNGKPMLPPGITNSTSTTNAPTLHQTTNIQITGGSDPVSTGDAVARAQGRVNGMAIGTLKGATQ